MQQIRLTLENLSEEFLRRHLEGDVELFFLHGRIICRYEKIVENKEAQDYDIMQDSRYIPPEGGDRSSDYATQILLERLQKYAIAEVCRDGRARNTYLQMYLRWLKACRKAEVRGWSTRIYDRFFALVSLRNTQVSAYPSTKTKGAVTNRSTHGICKSRGSL